jgi:DNA-binding MarR family transcriptional regulator
MIANTRSVGKGLSEGQITLAEARSLIIRNGLLRNLSPAEYRVLDYLLTYFNKLEPSDIRQGFHRAVNAHDERKGADRRTCWPKQDRIAEHVGMSIRTVKRAIVELEQFGILVTQRKKRLQAGGFVSQNRYAIKFPSRWFVEVTMLDGTRKKAAAQARPLTRAQRNPKAALEADTASPPPPEASTDQSATGVPDQSATGVPLKCIGQMSKTSMSGIVSQPQTQRADDAEPTPGQLDSAGAATANPPRAMNGATASPATHNTEGALARAAGDAETPVEASTRNTAPIGAVGFPGGREAVRAAHEPYVDPRLASIPEHLRGRVARIQQRPKSNEWSRGGEDELATRKAVRRAARQARARSGNAN